MRLSENVLLSTVNTGTYIFKEIYIYKIIANQITVKYRSQYIRSYNAIHQLKTNLHTVASCFQSVYQWLSIQPDVHVQQSN